MMKKLITLLLLLISPSLLAMVELNDEQLAGVTGQALMQMNKIVGDGTTANGTAGMTFYTAGLDVQMELNMNIEKLQLGCGGVNGVGCDLDIDNFSLGCIANSSGNCISLNPASGSSEMPGTIGDCGTSNCTSGSGINVAQQNQMTDFSMLRPFFQFAIKNDGSKTQREVVGIRLGAENVSGPLSFGSLNTFSGFMSGELDLALRGAQDVAVTCPYAARPCIAPGADTSGMIHQGASSWGSPAYPSGCGGFFNPCDRGGKGAPAGGYLNLGDDMILDIGLADIRFQEALVGYSDVIRNNNGVELSGNRENTAYVDGVSLGGVVNSIVYGNTDGSTTVGANPLTLNDSDAGALVGVFGPTLLPLLRGGIADQIKRQMAQGLRIYNPDAATNQGIINGKSDADINNDLNAYQLPFNVTNVHQVDVNSNLFGLSFQKQSVAYPGYQEAMLTGWSMYAPDAFSLNVDQPTTELMTAITGNSNARDGNITTLGPSYRNCWGTARFC